MTLPMDVRLAADDAKIGFVFTRRGITPEACSSWFLPRPVGISQAMEWAATGRLFPASEALRAGLVRSIHPRDGVVEAARELASKVVEHRAPVSVALTRQLMWRRMLGAPHPMNAHRAESRALFERGVLSGRARGCDRVPREAGSEVRTLLRRDLVPYSAAS